ncbi:MAG: PAS domain-containing protein, partial [Magnetovibrio sp.]|nr:PAS domain-containing protein [Magnetovibrio sp.]
PEAGGQGAGFVTYRNAAPILLDQKSGLDIKPDDATAMTTMLRQLSQLGEERSNQIAISHDQGNQLVLSATSPILRKRTNGQIRVVGRLATARILGQDFDLSMTRSTGVDFRILPHQIFDQFANLTATRKLAIQKDVPELELDGNPDHSTAHKWVSSESHFLGLVRMLDQHGSDIFFVFTQPKNALQSTLQAFRSTIILVFVITGLSIVPMGLYFLNRTITRPVENLVNCTDNLRRGHHQAMEGFSGTDEFSDLARSFQIMSAAVQAREEALTQSQKSLKTAQRIARIGNWEWNIKTDRIKYSDEIYNILDRGYQSLGHHIDTLLDCVHENDVRDLKQHILDTVESGHDFQLEHRIVLPGGEERYVIHHGEAHLSHNKVVRINVTLQDITERHQLEQAKGELISTVSHELRTPLTSITGTLALAVGGALGELPETLKNMLNIANKNAKRLGFLIDDLLDIEKVTNRSMSLALRPITIADMLHRGVDDNQAYAASYGITFDIVDAVPNVQILADPGRMAQVMANLLSNAAKFSPQGGTVSIQIKETKNTVVISFKDHGPGIAATFRPLVFERFTQADQSTTRKDQKGGTGLGLAITKAIIELHDGSIHFDTTCAPDPSHGTTFTFELPKFVSIQDERS